nr:competence protein ComK [Listeria costaricensis]
MKKGLDSSKSIYEINPHTMMILPKITDGELHSEILELNARYISKFTPFEIIKTSCKLYGASFIGRKDGTKHLIGVTHKPPLIIDPLTFTYAFPTASPQNPNCIWVFPQHIRDYDSFKINQTAIQFANLNTYEIDISLHSFNNQVARTSMLHMKYSQKVRAIEAEYPYINMFFPPATLAAEKQLIYQVDKKLHNEK